MSEPDRDVYVNPLATRYASREMLEIFGQNRKFRTWRRLWLALARAQRDLVLPQPVPRSRYEATPALLAWLDVCAGQLAADDNGVRAGATAALLSAGKLAIPALKEAAKRDERIAPTAARIIAQIERQEQRRAAPSEASTRP